MNKNQSIKRLQEEFSAHSALKFTNENLLTVQTHFQRLAPGIMAVETADPKNPAVGRLVRDFVEAQKHLQTISELDSECGRAQSDILSGSLGDEEINTLQAELEKSEDVIDDLLNEVETLWTYIQQDTVTLAQAYQAAARLNA